MEDQTNQPKVSTNYSKSIEKRNKILSVLKLHPEGLFPKSIAYYSSLNVNTVKSALKLIPEIKKKQEIRGLYYLDEKDTHSIFAWKFHNLIITCPIPSYENKLIEKTIELNSLKLILIIGEKSKNATLHISSEPPIEMQSFLLCLACFRILIKQYANIEISTKEMVISSIELNQDYTNIRLDGLNCIRVDSLLTQHKIYNKDACVREEFKFKVPIEANFISSLLDKGLHYSELSHKIDEESRGILSLQKQMATVCDYLKEILRMRYDRLKDGSNGKSKTDAC